MISQILRSNENQNTSKECPTYVDSIITRLLDLLIMGYEFLLRVAHQLNCNGCECWRLLSPQTQDVVLDGNCASYFKQKPFSLGGCEQEGIRPKNGIKFIMLTIINTIPSRLICESVQFLFRRGNIPLAPTNKQPKIKLIIDTISNKYIALPSESTRVR